MSKNEVNQNLINHYLEPQKEKRTSLISLKSSKKTGNTLNDFYSEVQAKRSNSMIENIYNGKNATQIEMIMIQNRKLIEKNYTKH
ncbi:MAG: hypothetical protein M1300_10040 [Epsilonproteobacteria bacterium]|nr:hypothetical protein [Campylobacterota bacterium]